MVDGRTARGRETERLLAADLRASGAPDAEAVGASLKGRDIRRVPGLAIEVKARARFDPRAWLRQAKKNSNGDFPIVVLRCNGQGPAQIDEWVGCMTWKDLKTLLREAGYLA